LGGNGYDEARVGDEKRNRKFDLTVLSQARDSLVSQYNTSNSSVLYQKITKAEANHLLSVNWATGPT